MASWQISFLGSYQLTGAAGEILISQRKVMALLAFLALEAGQAHSRESLMGLLWPELPEAAARNNLRVSLARLRKKLGKANASLITATRKEVRFQLEDGVHFDVAVFQSLLSESEQCDHNDRARCLLCQERLTTAVNLYHGPLLHGFYLDDCPAFDEWLFVQRERLHLQMLEILDELAQGLERNGHFPEATAHTRRQIELDPLHDSGQRRLICLLAYQGQRTAALTQYQTYATLLRDELGVEPDLEMHHLMQQIEAEILPLPTAELPIEREPSHRKSSLPENLTPFIGREKELAQLAERLAAPDYRLISLVGPGGIGKTRLALQAARANLHHYQDGAFFVPLAPVERVEDIATAVADALKLPLTNSAQPPQEQLIQHLTAQKTLLIMDNMEHLVDGVDLLLDILRRCPDAVLLVTSRQRLNVQAEDMFRLRGLPVPGADQIDQAGQFASIRLFCDRAHRLQKSFKLTPQNSPDIVAICRAVEGLPLGLMLAACWIRDFPVAELAQMVSENVDILQTTLRDIAPQHRSIRAVFDTSWRLLSPAEQEALARLAVFRSGFTLAAAKQVAGVSPLALTRLRYKSLLRRSGNGRYTMHELLRQFSRRRLNERPLVAEETEREHGRYFLSLLQEQADRLNGIDAARAGAALHLELDNIRQAWRWAVETSTLDLLRQSAGDLATFLEHIGLAYEGVQLLQLAVDTLPASPDNNRDLLPFLLVKQLSLRQSSSTLDEDMAIIERILSLTEQNPALSHLEAETCLYWSKSSLEQVSDPKKARVYLDRAFASSEKLDDPEFEARLLCESGRNYLYDGQFDKAIAVLEKALIIFEELAHIPGQALVYSHLAPAYAEGYRLGPALFCDRKALSLYAQLDNRTRLGIGHHNLAETYVLLGAYEQAREHTLKSLEISRQQGSKVNEANTLSLYAAILEGLGQIEEAETKYRAAIAAQKAMKLSFSLRFSLLDWGMFQWQQGWLTEAEITLDEAIALNNDLDHLRLTSQAKQALVYLTQSQRKKEALALADTVWREIEPGEGAGLPFPIHTLYECYTVFQTCGDERAEAVLQMAAETLKRTAVEIEDPEMRTLFLNNVPVNRQLRAALHQAAAFD